LLLQQDTADTVIGMLKGAMDELLIANPAMLSTDIGPVIDSDAMRIITDYVAEQKSLGRSLYQSPAPQAAAVGNFVVPTMVEIDSLDDVNREIFGPILHVLRYRRQDLNQVLDDINSKEFGLTFGVHTRINEVSLHCVTKIEVGNVYVNRNIIGASVGVQPFGGQGLSGTGPKAGGPLYLKSLVHTDGYTLPPWAQAKANGGTTDKTDETSALNWPAELELPGPTGESNVYQLLPRGPVLCLAQSPVGLMAMCEALARTGNTPQVLKETAAALDQVIQKTQAAMSLRIDVVHGDLSNIETQAVLFEGDADQLLAVQQTVAQREGSILSVFGLRTAQIEAGQTWPLHRLLHEKSICINTAAAGGNASLMTLV